MLLTKIPHFNDQILMSFSCPHCHYANCNVQSASGMQEKGVKYTLHLSSPEDLNRAIKVTDTATFRIEELDTHKRHAVGQVSNLEGILHKMAEGLTYVTDRVKEVDPKQASQVKDTMSKIELVAKGLSKVTITMDDPAGNAWLERLPTDTESKFTCESYKRAQWQEKELGYDVEMDDPESFSHLLSNPEHKSTPRSPEALLDEELGGIENGHLYNVLTDCPHCRQPAMINYHTMDIPYFKEVVISAINCSECDYRINEISSGGAIPEKGKRITLKVNQSIDLNRDILKSQTCAVTIPELEFNMGAGTMGGRFTTVEGLLSQARNDIHHTVAPTIDWSDPISVRKWDQFYDRLDAAIEGRLTFTLVLEDPLANSYVQSLNSPEPDPQMQTEEYERTEEENEDLGLLDMKTRLDADGNYVAE